MHVREDVEVDGFQRYLANGLVHGRYAYMKYFYHPIWSQPCPRVPYHFSFQFSLHSLGVCVCVQQINEKFSIIIRYSRSAWNTRNRRFPPIQGFFDFFPSFVDSNKNIIGFKCTHTHTRLYARSISSHIVDFNNSKENSWFAYLWHVSRAKRKRKRWHSAIM